jgi:uncharacterized protein (UPF0276 family)
MLSEKAGNALPPRAGIGLKPQHYRDILDDVGGGLWFEAHPENYMGAGGPPHAYLSRIRAKHALSLHGVGLSLGGAARPDRHHLRRLKALIDRYQPASFSEHLAWSGHNDRYFNDLLALPYTQETLDLVCRHIDETQEFLGTRLLLENPSSYVLFAHSEIDEIEFMTRIAARTGCGLLLDVNNAFVSCRNRGEDAAGYIDRFPASLVGEVHLAGHAAEADDDGRPLLIDSHDRAVCVEVWQLYARFIGRAGPRPTLIERDNDIPPLEVLAAEAAAADAILAAAALPQRHGTHTSPFAGNRAITRNNLTPIPRLSPRRTPGLLTPALSIASPRSGGHKSTSLELVDMGPGLRGDDRPIVFELDPSRRRDSLLGSTAWRRMRWPAEQQTMALAVCDAAADVPAFIRAPGSAAAGRRFDVYRNNMALGLIEALKADYPVVTRLVGVPFMNAMARDYVRRELPTSPVLLAYGGGFADFVAGYAPAASLPYLADVARLEWAWLEAYHAADAEPLDVSSLAAIDPDRLADLRLALLPSLRLVASEHPVAAIWAAHQGGEPGQGLAAIAPRAEHVIVGRPLLDVDMRLVTAAVHAFIASLLAGATLGAALAACEDETDFDASAAIALLFSARLVTGLGIAPTVTDQ